MNTYPEHAPTPNTRHKASLANISLCARLGPISTISSRTHGRLGGRSCSATSVIGQRIHKKTPASGAASTSPSHSTSPWQLGRHGVQSIASSSETSRRSMQKRMALHARAHYTSPRRGRGVTIIRPKTYTMVVRATWLMARCCAAGITPSYPHTEPCKTWRADDRPEASLPTASWHFCDDDR